MIGKHLCLILFTGTRIRIDSVMHPRSSSRGRSAIQVPQLQLQLEDRGHPQVVETSATLEHCRVRTEHRYCPR